MSFAWPQLLWLLLCPAALLAWDLTHRRRTTFAARPKILRAEAGARSLKLSSFEAGQAPRTTRPRWWLCLGLALCVAALARPQWGRLDEPVFEQSHEIILAIDLSRSMLAPDVRPSRLERAKLLIRSLLEKLAGERVGLVVFSGTAFLQAPLSADYEILLEFLPALGPAFLPEGGTNYRAMLDAALGAFVGTAGADRYLIVLSDGEATDDEWKARAPQLKAKGIRVIGLGVGTAAGTMVPDEAGGFIKDERGAVVLTKLESATLQELAQATGGVYRDASTWVDLAALLQETIESGRKGQFVETNTVRLVERFQWPLAFGLWFLLVSFYYEFPIRPRTRDIVLRETKPQRAEGKGQRAAVPAAVTTVALFALGALLFAPSASAGEAPAALDVTGGAPAAPAAPPNLAKIVGRLSSAATQTGRDWAELATETVSWGSRIQFEKQPVPEGPVRDALSAVDLGSKLDPKTADWPKLREELASLLKKPEEQKQDQDDQQQQQQKQDQQKEDQKQKENQSADQKSPDDPNSPPQDQKESSTKPQDQKKKGESAFGDMNQKDDSPPPPPPDDIQKVGGSDKQNQDPVDPALALPLQKLDQLRNQDSPAQLFRLMEGEKKAVKKPVRDW